MFRGSKTARAPQGAATLFMTYLREEGVLPPAPRPPRPEETWPVLAAFRRWMREQRGVADSTLDLRERILVDLLRALGDDPAAYTAAAMRGFVLERAKPHGRGRAQTIAVATRSFLQLPGGDRTVPGRPRSRRPGLRELAARDDAALPRLRRLDRVLAACDGEDRFATAPSFCSSPGSD